MTTERERELEELLRQQREQSIRDTAQRERDLDLILRRDSRTLGGDLGEMTGNYPQDLFNYAKTGLQGLASVATNPIEAALEGIEFGEAVLEKGGRKFEEFYTGEEIPPSRPDVEAPLDDVIDYYREKFGTLERARQSFIDEPVQSTADVFPVIGQRFGPAAATRKVGGRVGGEVSDRLQRRAAGIPRSMEDGLSLSREAARKNINVSEGGLKEARRMRKLIGERLERMVMDRVETGGTGKLDDMGIVNKEVILKYMDDLIDEHRNTFDADTMVPFLKKEKVRLMNVFGDRKRIGLEDLHNYKTKTYRKAYKQEAAGPTPEVETLEASIETMRQTARAAKERLENEIQGYAKTNRDFEVYARMIPFIKKRIDAIPPDEFWGSMMYKTLGNPNFQSKMAIGLRKLADGDLGWVEKNFNTPEIRTLMYLIGQHQEDTPEAIPVWTGKQ